MIKPFTGTVNASGQAQVIVSQNLHGLVWKVYQLGLALGKVALSAQVAAHVNGIPLTSTVTMQLAAFANMGQAPPYAMESFMVGPPYIILSAGDQLVVAVINAVPGDAFTVGAYVDERDASMAQDMGS
jgi:hypothetical protein